MSKRQVILRLSKAADEIADVDMGNTNDMAWHAATVINTLCSYLLYGESFAKNTVQRLRALADKIEEESNANIQS